MSSSSAAEANPTYSSERSFGLNASIKNAFDRDLTDLIQTFEEKSTLKGETQPSFQTFKEAWETLRFGSVLKLE